MDDVLKIFAKESIMKSKENRLNFVSEMISGEILSSRPKDLCFNTYSEVKTQIGQLDYHWDDIFESKLKVSASDSEENDEE